MIRSPFVFLEDPQKEGTVYVMQTAPPFAYSQVWFFKTNEERDGFLTRQKKTANHYLHFNIVLVYAGAFMKMQGATINEEAVLKEMANFYFIHRISPNESRYKRYLRKD